MYCDSLVCDTIRVAMDLRWSFYPRSEQKDQLVSQLVGGWTDGRWKIEVKDRKVQKDNNKNVKGQQILLTLIINTVIRAGSLGN